MKLLLQLFFCSSLLVLGLHFTACESNPKIVKQTDKTAKEYTSMYICPMKCVGSGSNKPDKCPACKMDYTMNEKAAAPHDHGAHDGHNHDHGSHKGHNH